MAFPLCFSLLFDHWMKATPGLASGDTFILQKQVLTEVGGGLVNLKCQLLCPVHPMYTASIQPCVPLSSFCLYASCWPFEQESIGRN